ncbi:MAG: hypothetical protein IJQ00_09515, partial [Kiritimatiellae bacterium]|nr:hypothetical protein [Kiritimatiellia bacterium]
MNSPENPEIPEVPAVPEDLEVPEYPENPENCHLTADKMLNYRRRSGDFVFPGTVVCKQRSSAWCAKRSSAELAERKESVRQRKRHADRKAGCAEMHRRSFASEGTSPKATRRARKRVRDRRAEAQPYKGMSQTKVMSSMYASKFPTERSP